jgi:hypothetical protein
MQTYPDCGCRVYKLGCVNCEEAACIEEQEMLTELCYPAGARRSVEHLECPCCGDDGAVSDAQGWFSDGQPLICGCPGWVSVDEDEAWINACNEPCAKCERESGDRGPGKGV